VIDKQPQDKGKMPVADEDESPGLLAGQRLAEARRANDITIAEIAKELHLDEPKVQALEENQFEVLGAPVFAKGHLRKYAELVGMPIDEMLADYYKLNRSTGAPPVVGPRRARPPRDIALGRWIGGVMLVLILGGLSYWWTNREPSQEPASAAGVLEPFATEQAADETDGSNESLPPENSDDEAVDVIADNIAAPGQAQDLAPTVVEESAVSSGGDIDGQVQLVMEYSGDCWTEVTDANGERLFFGLGQAGRTVSRNGTPPLRALFGDYSNVSVKVDGVEFPISASARRGKTARVTINTP
jgi:cytoskeleton protein RodZ